MAKGDFDNLKGTGKPLPERSHVITDFTTHKVAKYCAHHIFRPKQALYELVYKGHNTKG